MTKEYIDRETVKAWLHEEDFGTPDERWRPESEFGAMIDALPAADVVEVVRCKDCKYFWEYNKVSEGNVEGADGDCYFRLMCSVDEQFNAVRYCDFCSYGERKEQA